LGIYRNIKLRNLTAANVRNYTCSGTCFPSRVLRSIGIVLIALLASLVPAASTGAKPSIEPRRMEGVALRQGQVPQNHSAKEGQYHGRWAGFRRISAWNAGSSRPGAEMTSPIAMDVISRLLRFHSAVSNTNAQDSLGSRTNVRIGAQNDRSIGNRIGSLSCSSPRCYAKLETLADPGRYQGSTASSRDPRLMLQIGAVLGLVYLAFLAAWIWATRFRIQPPRSAAT
jgi:hypothetical protein